jgi:cytochrome c-type biogenesis protein CcmH
VKLRMLVISVSLLSAGTALAFAATRGPAPAPALAERVRAVASTLRCPVCQNLSVADSPSTLAHDMRASIARDLKAGKAPDEIREEFVAAYGEWILLSPRPRGINWVAWLAPVALLIGGVAVAGAATRRWTAGSEPGHGTDAQPDPVTKADRRLLESSLLVAPEDPE